jgi:hypothetical protein
LCRPSKPQIETLNDADCYIANFWRATQADPDAVATFADGPVNEADLHARHSCLMNSAEAVVFREKMRTDPRYFDPEFAGWWCWGLCCWIGSGWCQSPGSAEWDRRPALHTGKGRHGRGVHSEGKSASAEWKQLPALTSDRGGGMGVYGDAIPEGKSASAEWRQIPNIATQTIYGSGVHGGGDGSGNRPQLADAYSRGRGVNSHDSAETCRERREWLIGWFGRIRDRLRTVRVCCGDWRRVCTSVSVTTRLGLTGVFLDPPYSHESGRAKKLYGMDSGTVAHEVRAYCLKRGDDPLMRICLAGLTGEGHEALEAHGWGVVAWKSDGGYGNRTERGKANRSRERLWFSPNCLDPSKDLYPLFPEGRK